MWWKVCSRPLVAGRLRPGTMRWKVCSRPLVAGRLRPGTMRWKVYSRPLVVGRLRPGAMWWKVHVCSRPLVAEIKAYRPGAMWWKVCSRPLVAGRLRPDAMWWKVCGRQEGLALCGTVWWKVCSDQPLVVAKGQTEAGELQGISHFTLTPGELQMPYFICSMQGRVPQCTRRVCHPDHRKNQWDYRCHMTCSIIGSVL